MCQPVTAKARVQSQDKPCAILRVQSALGQVCLQVLRDHSTIDPYSFIYLQQSITFDYVANDTLKVQ